jgi:tetratricopeptide (TPR) repeat protein
MIKINRSSKNWIYDLAVFDKWLTENYEKKVDSKVYIGEIEPINNPLAFLRISQLYSNLGDRKNWYEFAVKAAKSKDFLIRIAAHIELTLHEFDENYELNKGFNALLSPLFLYLDQINSIFPKENFTIEVELRILIAISSICVEAFRFDEAYMYSSRAILIAKEIGVTRYRNIAYLNFSLASLRLGKLDEAYDGYGVVINNTEELKFQKKNSIINQAMILGFWGDTDIALEYLKKITLSSENGTSSLIFTQYWKAMKGEIGQNEEIRYENLDNYYTQTKCIKIILNQDKICRDALENILIELKQWNPSSNLVLPMKKWLQGYIYCNLQLYNHCIKSIDSTKSPLPSVQILLLALRLEVALNFQNTYPESIEDLCVQISLIFQNTRNQTAKEGLAKLISFWHPLASGFLAFSPLCGLEMFEFGSKAIFRDGRPITVYGKKVSTRLPFVQKSLENFGFRTSIERDQSVERERLAKALMVQMGDRQHLLQFFSPGLIIYNLIRVSEIAGQQWRFSALGLARSHGLIPTTLGGYLRNERRQLQSLLERLIKNEVTSSQFKKEVLAMIEVYNG